MKKKFVFGLFFSSSQLGPSGQDECLLIAIADRSGWVGCMDGHPQARTPNIDRLAKGMLFVNAHCQGLSVALTSLLSGSIRTDWPLSTTRGKAMEKDEEFSHGRMMPQFFSAHGYATRGWANWARTGKHWRLRGEVFGVSPKPQ